MLGTSNFPSITTFETPVRVNLWGMASGGTSYDFPEILRNINPRFIHLVCLIKKAPRCEMTTRKEISSLLTAVE